VVRVVHSLFASTDDWDGQLESIESGWPGLFSILRLYLQHFAGQRCASFQVLAIAPAPVSSAWGALTAGLGLAGVAEGGRWAGGGRPPPSGGGVGGTGEGPPPPGLLRPAQPVPGIAFVHAAAMGGPVMLMIALYLYGAGAPQAVGRDEPAWQAWMSQRF